MKITRYNELLPLVAFNKPRRIIEIGTHKGKIAAALCREALKHQEKVHYIGYDLFEDATDETNKREYNGKGAGCEDEARKALEAIPGVTFELIKGDTRQTLHGQDVRADFVFIDGGHSVETIRGDYEAVKHSRLIAFDDYYTDGVDTNKFGCNRVVSSLPFELVGSDRDTHIAVVGYSSKWAAAINRVLIGDNHKDATLWRGDRIVPSDLVCAINVLEGLLDIDAKLDELRQTVTRRLFFVLKIDALRSLDWWRKKMENYFHILEWIAPNGDEVVGTAMPLVAVGEWKSIGAMTNDERFDHAKLNVAVTDKRVMPLTGPNGEFLAHNRTAVIVGYGPSLKETWPEIVAERRLNPGDVDVISMSGSHDFLLRRDVTPDYHVECDPRPHKAANITRPNDKTKYYLASCCHPDLIQKLKYFDLSLWHLMNGQESFRITDEIESERNQPLVCGGGSVGLRSIALFYGLGYRKFLIFGMDCAFGRAEDGSPVNSRDKDVQRWAGIHKGKKKDVIKVRCGDKWFLTSPVDVTYTRHFIDTAQRSEGASFSFVGEGLLSEMVKLMNQENAA
jgi:predicted O-methyltransferase YrrM